MIGHPSNRIQKGAIIGWVIIAVAIGLLVFALLQAKNSMVIENPAPPGFQPTRFVKAPEPIVSPELPTPEPNKRLEILNNSLGFLNVRSGPSVNNQKIGNVRPGEQFEYTEQRDGWYHILFVDGKDGWVSGEYVRELD